MSMQKCPRCELNYIKEGEQFCNVCRRSMNMKVAREEQEQNLCIECGEHTALKGQDLCAYCYSEKRRREKMEKFLENPSSIMIDMDQLDEVEVSLPSDIPSDELRDIHSEFGEDDEEGDEDGFDDEENEDGY